MTLRPLLTAVLGVGFGLAYYQFVGCVTGACWITASPILSGGYWGIAGFFVGGGITWVRAVREAVRPFFGDSSA